MLFNLLSSESLRFEMKDFMPKPYLPVVFRRLDNFISTACYTIILAGVPFLFAYGATEGLGLKIQAAINFWYLLIAVLISFCWLALGVIFEICAGRWPR